MFVSRSIGGRVVSCLFFYLLCTQGTRLAALLPQEILETFREKATPGPRGKEVKKAAFDEGMQVKEIALKLATSNTFFQPFCLLLSFLWLV